VGGYRVAIVGATGLVGQEFIKVLEQRNFPVAELRLFASDRSAGRRLTFKGEELPVLETSEAGFKGVELALFSAGAEVSREWAPVAVRAGAVVIDNSAAWRMEPDVPLVVPEVNPEDVTWHRGIIANPNCSTIQMVVAVNPIHRVNRVRRVTVATYQSVSGSGSAALEELRAQAEAVLRGEAVRPSVYPHQIGFNLLPHIDRFYEDGYTKEELKMLQETRKILHEPELPVSATCVRVPVFVGHSEAVHLELTEPISPAEAREILSRAPGVVVLDDPARNVYPTPWDAAGRDEVFVGRIREDKAFRPGLAMWVVADNVRKGAALNAVQIAEELIRRGLL